MNQPAPAIEQHPGPYIGLRPFKASERELFFGRERDAMLLRNKILSNNLTLLYAPSGVGKTSLLVTSVMPLLREQNAHVVYFDKWYASQPDQALKEIVANSAGGKTAGDASMSLAALAKQLLLELDMAGEIGDRDADCSLIILLDQFEKFLLHPAGLEPLRSELGELVRAGLNVRVVMSIREEYLSGIDVFRDQITNLFASTYHLEPLDDQRAEEAIIGPAAKFGVGYARDLLTTLLDDLKNAKEGPALPVPSYRKGRVELPFLQIICQRLWETRNDSPELTLAQYQELGGRKGIIEAFVEKATTGLSWQQKYEAARILDRLAPRSGLKASYTLQDLSDLSGISAERINYLLRHFEQHMIVRSRKFQDQPSYELYHDAYISVLKDWCKTQLARHERLKRMAASLLMLVTIIGGGVMYLRQVNEREAENIAAEAVSYFDSDPALGLGKALEAAERLQNPTDKVREILAQALLEVRHPPLSFNKAGTIAPTLSDDGRFFAVADPQRGSINLLEVPSGRVAPLLNGHFGRINRLLFSPDGQQVATASSDGSARLWRVSDGRQLKIFRHSAPVTGIAFSPDGHTLASASLDASIVLWDVASGNSQKLAPGNPVSAIAFSPNGQWLAATTAFTGLGLWTRADATSFNTQPRWFPDTAGYTDLAFSPDSGYLAASSIFAPLRLFPMRQGTDSGTRILPTGIVTSLAFNRSGERIVTAEAGLGVRLWDWRHGGRQTPAGLDAILGARFGSDDTLATWRQNDARIQLWADRGQRLAGEFIGHPQAISDVSFSPDGKLLASASDDGSTRIWEMPANGGIKVLSLPSVNKAELANNGRYLATSSYASPGVSCIWDLQQVNSKPIELIAPADKSDNSGASTTGDGLCLPVAEGQRQPASAGQTLAQQQINALHFSYDGKWVLSAGDDRTIHWWETSTGKHIDKLARQAHSILGATLSNDKRYLAGASSDGKARIWDQAGKHLLATLPHDRPVKDVRFSDDLHYLASISDQTAIVWDIRSCLETGNACDNPRSIRLSGHTAVVNSARFSPDSAYLISASDDKSAIVWHIATARKVAILKGHTAAVTAATIVGRGDQARAITVSLDKTARIYPCDAWCKNYAQLLEQAKYWLRENAK